MHTILALDTATENCSAALKHEGKIYFRQEVASQKHANLILPMVDEILKEANIKKEDIDYLAFGHGPGSFTGVRVATSAIQGLALGLDLKVQGVSDLKAMAYESYTNANDKDASYISSIDARMSELYLCAYKINDKGQLEDLFEECVVPYDRAKELIQAYCGTGKKYSAGTGAHVLVNEGLSEIGPILVEFPDARSIIEVASYDFSCFKDAIDAQPVYLRNEVTWRKINEQ